MTWTQALEVITCKISLCCIEGSCICTGAMVLHPGESKWSSAIKRLNAQSLEYLLWYKLVLIAECMKDQGTKVITHT